MVAGQYHSRRESGRAADVTQRAESAAWEKACVRAMVAAVADMNPEFVQCRRCGARGSRASDPLSVGLLHHEADVRGQGRGEGKELQRVDRGATQAGHSLEVVELVAAQVGPARSTLKSSRPPRSQSAKRVSDRSLSMSSAPRRSQPCRSMWGRPRCESLAICARQSLRRTAESRPPVMLAPMKRQSRNATSPKSQSNQRVLAKSQVSKTTCAQWRRRSSAPAKRHPLNRAVSSDDSERCAPERSRSTSSTPSCSRWARRPTMSSGVSPAGRAGTPGCGFGRRAEPRR